MDDAKKHDENILSDAHQAAQIAIAIAGNQQPSDRLLCSHRVHVDGQLHRIKAIRKLLDKMEAALTE